VGACELIASMWILQSFFVGVARDVGGNSGRSLECPSHKDFRKSRMGYTTLFLLLRPRPAERRPREGGGSKAPAAAAVFRVPRGGIRGGAGETGTKKAKESVFSSKRTTVGSKGFERIRAKQNHARVRFRTKDLSNARAKIDALERVTWDGKRYQKSPEW